MFIMYQLLNRIEKTDLRLAVHKKGLDSFIYVLNFIKYYIFHKNGNSNTLILSTNHNSMLSILSLMTFTIYMIHIFHIGRLIKQRAKFLNFCREV